jgi:N utilization substance protein B
MASEADARRARRNPAGDARVRSRRAGRRLALAAVFEAEFGQRTADAILERHLALEGDPETAALARELVGIVVVNREALDARITAVAPQYPVVQLARMDRALLRCGLGEVLHSPATPARVAIAEWVELARTYSGEPMRRLMNGVLGRVARDIDATR